MTDLEHLLLFRETRRILKIDEKIESHQLFQVDAWARHGDIERTME